MVTAAQVQPRVVPSGFLRFWPAAVLALTILLVYSKTLFELLQDWWTNPDYSFGLLIPAAIGFSLLAKREDLVRVPFRPQSVGLGIAIAAQGVYLVGYLGAEFFLQRVSLLLFTVGALVFIAGWQLVSKIRFEYLLAFLAVPLPVIVFNRIALPLQLLASKCAEWSLHACAVPVYREGNILELPFEVLNVTEACSGIRSLISLFTLAVVIAHFSGLRFGWRLVFVLSSVPIAIAANALRVTGTGLLAETFGVGVAKGFFHLFTGWCVFVSAFLCMQLLMTLMKRWHGSAEAKA